MKGKKDKQLIQFLRDMPLYSRSVNTFPSSGLEDPTRKLYRILKSNKNKYDVGKHLHRKTVSDSESTLIGNLCAHF